MYFPWRRILHPMTKQIPVQNQKIYFSMPMQCIWYILHLHKQQQIDHLGYALSSGKKSRTVSKIIIYKLKEIVRNKKIIKNTMLDQYQLTDRE